MPKGGRREGAGRKPGTITPGYVPKEPFRTWFLELKEKMSSEFIIERQSNSMIGGAGGYKSKKKGSWKTHQFDARRFAWWCGITKGEYDTLTRALRDPKRPNVSLSLVDRIVTCVLADPWVLHEWYPVPEDDPEDSEELDELSQASLAA